MVHTGPTFVVVVVVVVFFFGGGGEEGGRGLRSFCPNILFFRRAKNHPLRTMFM